MLECNYISIIKVCDFMNIIRYNKVVKIEKRFIGGINMGILAKPINRAFIIAEGKSEQFKRQKRSSKLDEILRRAKAIKVNK